MPVDITAVSTRSDGADFIQTGAIPSYASHPYADRAKRALDIALVLIAAPLAVMIVVMVCPFIMRDGGSPFVSQERVGRGGRVFRMWKLRSMARDAEDRLEAYLDTDPMRHRELDTPQKLRHDPRVTRIGRIIRKTSIDELPQLWNVLRGEMSMVGPRPMMPSQRALYPRMAYYAVRPGIAGFWQVSVRIDSNFAQRAEFDSSYFRELLLVTDLRVMLRTVRVVICDTG